MSSAKPGEFARLLDDLFQAGGVEAELDDLVAEAVAQPSIPFDYLAVVEELHSGRIHVTGAEASERYQAATASIEETLRELDRRLAEIVPPPLAPEIPPSIEPLDIARELSLHTLSRVDDLARVRRSFAFDNHPDRVAPELRERAIARMQIANMLIDEAQRGLKR